jgi:hypothetical protein
MAGNKRQAPEPAAEELPVQDEIVVEAEEASEPVVASDPLDHDDSGKKGGSKPGAASTRARGAAAKKSKEAGRSWIVLEENPDIPPTGLFLGHNGDGLLIVAGEPVLVEDKYIEILDQAETSVPHIDPSTQRVLSHRKRLRFPYRRVAAPRVDA